MSSINIVNLKSVDIETWLQDDRNVYIGRGGEWGNPAKLKDHNFDRPKVIALYESHIRSDKELFKKVINLKDKVLGCWCSPERCHGEVLHRLAGNIPAYDLSSNSLRTNMANTSTTTSTVLTTGTVVTISSSISPSGSDTSRRLTRQLSGTHVSSVYMVHKKSSPSSKESPSLQPSELSLETLNEAFQAQQLQLSSQSQRIDEQAGRIDDLITDLAQKDLDINNLQLQLKALKHDSLLTTSANKVKDCVIQSLQGEVHRLQQFTRRYCISITGIDKPDGKERHDELKKKVEKIITEIDSTTTVNEIDKLHRNGPARGKEQEVIVRFTSHSAKEAVYNNRKNLRTDKNIKIRPSLSPHSRSLLKEAQDHIKTYQDEDGDFLPGINNPPDFVFANVHGDLQVKMKNRVRKGMFFGFSTIEELSGVIANAQEFPATSMNKRYENWEAMVADDWACEDDAISGSHVGDD